MLNDQAKPESNPLGKWDDRYGLAHFSAHGQ